MHKKELYKKLENFQKQLSKENIPSIYEAIELFAPILTHLKNSPKNFLTDGSAGQQARSSINSIIQSVINKEKSLKYRKIIKESSEIENGIKETRELMKSEKIQYIEFSTKIEDVLENFLDSYEEHTRSYSSSTCLSLSIWASELQSVIESVHQVIKSVLIPIVIQDSQENLQRLELYLSNVSSLKDFAIKLQAISDIYNELLSLYGLSEHDHPILIEHLENGSLWIKILGHTLTTALLTSLLNVSTNYYQTNFTTTGQLQQLPISVQVANDLLKIADKLEADGIDTKDIKENIESATRRISKQLDILLSDQPIVEINDKKHNIGDTLSNKLIKQQQVKLIENAKEE